MFQVILYRHIMMNFIHDIESFQSSVKIIFLIFPGELSCKKIDEPMWWYVRHDQGFLWYDLRRQMEKHEVNPGSFS